MAALRFGNIPRWAHVHQPLVPSMDHTVILIQSMALDVKYTHVFMTCFDPVLALSFLHT